MLESEVLFIPKLSGSVYKWLLAGNWSEQWYIQLVSVSSTMNLLHRYAVAGPCKHLNDITASMTTSCQATGNNWSCFNMGVMQSNFLSPVAALATTFCTFWSWASSSQETCQKNLTLQKLFYNFLLGYWVSEKWLQGWGTPCTCNQGFQ